jgi:hypothetical protein
MLCVAFELVCELQSILKTDECIEHFLPITKTFSEACTVLEGDN